MENGLICCWYMDELWHRSIVIHKINRMVDCFISWMECFLQTSSRTYSLWLTIKRKYDRIIEILFWFGFWNFFLFFLRTWFLWFICRTNQVPPKASCYWTIKWFRAITNTPISPWNVKPTRTDSGLLSNCVVVWESCISIHFIQATRQDKTC